MNIFSKMVIVLVAVTGFIDTAYSSNLAVTLTSGKTKTSNDVVVLPSPSGADSFSVTAADFTAGERITVTANTGHVPLPVSATVCQVTKMNGACLAPAVASLTTTVVAGETPTFTVFVNALTSIPLDTTFHRVYVTATNDIGKLLGATSVAIQNATYDRQLYIGKGGTYSGNWENRDWSTGLSGAGNAVYIDTTEPVVIENCFVRSSGTLIQSAPGANVTIRNCNGYGIDPAIRGQKRGYFFFSQQIGSLTMEHNYLEAMAFGVAIWSNSPTERWTPPGPIIVRYNRVRNLDGAPSDGAGGHDLTIIGNGQDYGNIFFSVVNLDFRSQAELAWNDVINEPYISFVGDVIDIWASSGNSSTAIDIHDNYIQGGFPAIMTQANGSTSNPSRVMLAGAITPDGSSVNGVSGENAQTTTAFLKIHNNQIVARSNQGIGVCVGHDIEIYENRIVSSGQLADGTWYAQQYGKGLSIHSNCNGWYQPPTVFYNNFAHDNVVGWRIEKVDSADPEIYVAPPLRADYMLSGCAGGESGPTSKCTNNVSLPDPITSDTEANEYILWQQKLATNGIALGPISAVISPLQLAQGWNLAGNGSAGPIAVANVLGESSKVTTVWKWVTSGSTAGINYPAWAFYTPTQNDGGQAYATSKGYDFLTTIKAGEGFWVNAKAEFNAPLPGGTAITSSAFQNIPSGWNLIATGDGKTPSQFNALAAPNTPLTTLWAWDAQVANWYFYAPSLEAKDGTVLADYIAAKNYLNFGNKVLDPTMGFWVNKP